jgi:hypothetical protein
MEKFNLQFDYQAWILIKAQCWIRDSNQYEPEKYWFHTAAGKFVVTGFFAMEMKMEKKKGVKEAVVR